MAAFLGSWLSLKTIYAYIYTITAAANHEIRRMGKRRKPHGLRKRAPGPVAGKR